jgi:hypothetical protein
MDKKSLKSSASSATDVMDGPELSNISSNGKDTRRATIPGNRHHKFMPQTSSKPTTVDARWNL